MIPLWSVALTSAGVLLGLYLASRRPPWGRARAVSDDDWDALADDLYPARREFPECICGPNECLRRECEAVWCRTTACPCPAWTREQLAAWFRETTGKDTHR